MKSGIVNMLTWGKLPPTLCTFLLSQGRSPPQSKVIWTKDRRYHSTAG